MSDTGYDNKHDSTTYEEDPLKFYLAAYSEAEKHNTSMRDRVIENRLLYDGIDRNLQDRGENLEVKRSALFIHETRVAIDTRFTAVSDRLDSDFIPVRLIVKEDNDEEIAEEKLRKKEDELNRALRESGYLLEVWGRQFQAAEIQPISIVKVHFEEKKGMVAKEVPFGNNPVRLMRHILKYKTMPPETRTEWNYGPIWSGVVTEWLDHDEVLYDPSAVSVSEMRYIIHRKWVSWNELVGMSKQYGWNQSKLKDVKHTGGQSGDTTEDKLFEEIDKEEGRERLRGYKEGKYLLCEFWYRYYNEKRDREEIKLMVVVRNSKIIKDGQTPYLGIEFPFHFKRSWPKLGSMEGDTSIELTRASQAVYNDSINAILDKVTYGLFLELWVNDTFTMKEKPTRGPGKINYCNDIEKMREIKGDTGDIQNLVLLTQMMASKIRQILNAPDTDQSVESASDQEKATKTRLRAMGSAKRLRRCLKDAANDFIIISKMIMAIKQQTDSSWILPVNVDVPILSGVYTPDDELRQTMEVWTLASSNNPLYASPLGQLKLRQLFEDILNKSRVKDIDARLLTSQELTQVLQIQLAAQIGQPMPGQIGADMNMGDIQEVNENQPEVQSNVA